MEAFIRREDWHRCGKVTATQIPFVLQQQPPRHFQLEVRQRSLEDVIDVDEPVWNWFKISVNCKQLTKLLYTKGREIRKRRCELNTCKTIVKFMSKNAGPWNQRPYLYEHYDERQTELEEELKPVKKSKSRNKHFPRKKRVRNTHSKALSRSLFEKERRRRDKRQGKLADRWAYYIHYMITDMMPHKLQAMLVSVGDMITDTDLVSLWCSHPISNLARV